MANSKYALQGMTESMARAMKKEAELSLKVAIEMSAFLKGRSTSEAKAILSRVLKKTQAIPYKKFNDGVGHRKGAGIAAGRYPQKGAQIFIDLIESVEANAQAKGLSSNLKIIHLAPQKTSSGFHSGRLRRRKFKRVHVEIAVQEVDKETKKKTEKVVVKKEAKTIESKVVESKPEHKPSETLEHKKPQSEPKENAPPKKKVAKKVQEDKQ
ncbi:MAG: 50S ribosomal protein L22 [Candidatus Woesearchaeota archaeon]|jgi:large subunit ribosomal protein L22